MLFSLKARRRLLFPSQPLYYILSLIFFLVKCFVFFYVFAARQSDFFEDMCRKNAIILDKILFVC